MVCWRSLDLRCHNYEFTLKWREQQCKFVVTSLHIAKDKQQVVQNLVQEALIADREHIGAKAAELAHEVNLWLQIWCSQFSIMQAWDLKLACQNPVKLDQCQVDAVNTCNEVDLSFCYFPIMGFVVERYIKDETKFMFNWKHKKLYNMFICLSLYKKCKNEYKVHVTGYHIHLTTQRLQKLVSQYLHMSLDKIMEVHQTQGE
ncbi:DNA topoisomerase [Massospora cicadina]|nr:DNA topoisomerase [Massospora cicadina]